MLNQDNLAAEAARLAGTLPPFPQVVLQLLDMLRDEDASLEALARLARNDPVITSGILATANRIRRVHMQSEVYDPFIGASLIGINQLRRIVVESALNKFLANQKGADFLLQHSRAVAIVAQELATLCGVSPEKAFVAGILHDIGQLCFHVMDADAFQEVYRQSAIDGKLLEREAAAFGVDHAMLGAELSRHWGLPDEFVAAIAEHHDGVAVSSPLQAVINVAESLTRALDIPSSPKNRLTKLNAAAVESLQIVWDSEEMRDCYGRCRARFRQTRF
ncbi:MAG TPA: HDOD domain-containing protein [Azonexus sp.]|nr:HDOD domain-containing protein [Azonexus sp.]